MGDLPPLGADDFAPYFEAIHGYAPFPWQARLAAHLVAGGGWPEVLDLPTGSGKTAAIDVAVFQLAVEAGRASRSAPLRVVYVVDRRTIVDQAHNHAQKIVRAIEQSKHGVLTVVRSRLASFGRDAVPLRTALLRGAIARSDLWARSPDQPLVAVSTVDQVGSRLLFRGYGVSDAMKPIHAGLLGNDVLYLLDEVHLSEPFRETLAAIGGRYGQWGDTRLRSPFAVVEMSATPGSSRHGTFRLEADDECHPVLSRRLQATKFTTLAQSAGRAFVSDVEKHVKPLVARSGATVAVVVNRVAAARELHERLSSVLKAADVHLLTGRMRPLDRDALEQGLFTRDLTGWGTRPTPPRAAPKNPKADAPVFVEVKEATAFDGQTATPDGRYRAINGRLVVTTPPEGRRIQQLWTTKEFGTDFVLKLEFRATPNADSGVFLRQPQLQCRDFLLAGPYNQLKQFKQGDWNELVVTVKGDIAHATCNGELLTDNMKLPATGPIGLEGDRGQMEYRRLRLKPLAP